MNRIFITSYFLCVFYTLYAQDTRVNFTPLLNGQNIELNKFYKINSTDSIEFTNLKFYISSIQYFLNNQLVYEESSSFHLIDLSKLSTTIFTIKNIPDKKYNYIKFNLGIDSLKNVSGAFGGDLDPTNGMYWTWQNGYINFKMEGKSNVSSNKNNEFEFHLGGYQFPFNAIQSVQLKLKNKKAIQIALPIDILIKELHLSTQKNIMSPSTNAVNILKNIAHLFYISK